ncbi:MAG: alpha/beta fold hydrolase [Pseudomonadales bacterium]|nr:alpha/beta fold hydrolase [Pseudomonadales bacterium]
MRTANTHLIYVHGLWLTGRESLFLRRRLTQEHGYVCHVFHYPSVSASMNEVTERLHQFAHELAARTRVDRLHFLGHSLGGLVLLRYLERYADQPPGRVVFLGTPSVCSKAAQNLARIGWIAPLIGRQVAEELLSAREPRTWRQPRELGIIAGSKPVGLGRLFVRFDGESDGTVAVDETRLPGATDHLVMPVSHTGMQFSARVARQIGEFLEHGRFGLR